jgi:hypothetical protein
MSSRINTVGQRWVYKAAVELLQKNGYNVENAKLTTSHIRSESLMTTGQSTYPFGILETQGGTNSGGKFPTEVRLRQADVFIVALINLQVAKPSSATDQAFRNVNWGAPLLFTTSGVPAAIEGAYQNGHLNLIADNDQLLYKWPTKLHYKAPVTQQNSVVYYTGATALGYSDSQDSSEDGWIPCEGNLILSGNASLEMTYNIGAAMAAIEATGRWILELYGVLAQGCSKTSNQTR